MKHWIHGVHVLGPKSKWAKFRRHPNVYPPGGGGATGGGGGGGVSAPPPSGGGGGGGGGGQAPPPPAPPSSPSGSTNISGAYQPPQQQQLEPASYGVPNPEMPVSPGLQGALDGTGPGYAPQVQPNAQQPQWQAPGQPAPGQPQPGQQQGQQQQVDPAWQALTQNLGRYGIPIPPNMTPEQGYMALANAMQGQQQRNYYADLGRSLHETGEIEQFQAWRQQQQAAQPQQEENLWNVPHFDKQWLSAVEEDPATGRIRSKQGYDPRIGVQVQSYYDFLNNAQQEMWKDPQQFMWKFTQPLVQQAVQEAIQGSFGQYQEQVSAQAIINANAQWLYNRDPATGRTVHAQDGRPQLSPQGAAYFNHLDHASRVLGIQGSNQQHQYAVGMLERDLLRQRTQQAAAQQQPGLQAQNLRQQPQQQAQWSAWGGQQQQAPAGMGHYANVNGAQQMAGAFTNGQQQEPPMMGSLADMMRQGFAQENITDQQIANDMRRTSATGGFGPVAQPGQQPVWGQPQGQLPGW